MPLVVGIENNVMIKKELNADVYVSLVQLLRYNVDLFAFSATDMPKKENPQVECPEEDKIQP